MNTGPDCIVENDWLSRPLDESDFELMRQNQDPSLLRRTEAPMDSLMLFCCDGGATHEEYLTISEVAGLVRLSPKTIKNKMARGTFKEGVHYFRPPGSRPLFKRSAVEVWVEQSREPDRENDDAILMHRDYQKFKAKGLDISEPILLIGHNVRQ